MVYKCLCFLGNHSWKHIQGEIKRSSGKTRESERAIRLHGLLWKEEIKTIQCGGGGTYSNEEVL